MIRDNWRMGTLIAVLALAAATWMLYGSACSGWWHYDDAAHLWFVMRHDQIWQYFAMPEVSRAASAQLVPWAFMLYRLIYVFCVSQIKQSTACPELLTESMRFPAHCDTRGGRFFVRCHNEEQHR